MSSPWVFHILLFIEAAASFLPTTAVFTASSKRALLHFDVFQRARLLCNRPASTWPWLSQAHGIAT